LHLWFYISQGFFMTCYAVAGIGAPYQVYGDISEWEALVIDLDRRCEIADVWKTGRGILNPNEMPKTLPFEAARKTIPHVFFSDNGIVICSAETRSIIEEADPGLHQFIPITVIQKNGQSAHGGHFILNVHYMQDTVLDEKTTHEYMGLGKPPMGARSLKMLTSSYKKPAEVGVSKAKLTTAHLWRETYYPNIYLMSDTLQDKFKEAGIKFFKTFKATEY
jgi:hypothetical protein